MNISQRQTVDRFSRALVFLRTSPPVLTGVSKGFNKQVQVLQNALSAIETVASARGSGTPAKAAKQRALLKRALKVNQLFPILRVARVLARNVAGMQHLVNMPARASSAQALLDAAKAVLRDVTPYEDQFIDHGLSDTFLKRLGTTIQALEAANQAHTQARQAAAGARGELKRALREGRDALTLLDSAVREMCDANPTLGAATLATWNTIVKPRGRAWPAANVAVNGTVVDVMGI